MKMSKQEVEWAANAWPANEEAPLTRDQQIELMQGAAERNAARIQSLMNKDRGK